MKKNKIYSKISYLLFVITIVSAITITNSCKKESSDPCEGITCLNGGECVNGECDCAEGYGGPDCSNQITPTKIRITKINVTRFPATESNGAGWDPVSGPDILPKLYDKNYNLIWESPTYYQDATQTTYTFNLNPSFDLTEPNDEYIIRLYDYDSTDPDDFMGGIIFTPYYNTNGFPNKITLDAGGEVAFELFVTYFW